MKKSRLARKMITGITAAGVMALGVMPVCAEDAKTDSMSVEYTKASSFMLNIPLNVGLSERREVESLPIGVSQINVGTKEKVQIKVSDGISNGQVSLKDKKDEDNIVKSTVSLQSGGTQISDNEVVAEFEGSNQTATKGGKLYFSALGDVPAGTYNGTITFSASIVNK